jgi:hypothetical protein
MTKRRVMTSFLLVVLSAGCVKESPSSWLRIEVRAMVNGRAVKSVRWWQVEVSDQFPQGASIKLKGSAVVIPLPNGQKVYALLRTAQNGEIASADRLVLGLDQYLAARQKAAGRTPPFPSSFERSHNYLSSNEKKKTLEFCLPNNMGTSAQHYCPLFVFFKNRLSLTNLTTLKFGKQITIGVDRILISSVLVSYDSGGGRDKDGIDSRLLTGSRRAVVATILNQQTYQQISIQKQDFWR